MAIVPVTPQIPAIGPAPSSSSGGTGAPGFADTLTRMVSSVEQSGGAANDAIGRMLDGSPELERQVFAGLERSGPRLEDALALLRV